MTYPPSRKAYYAVCMGACVSCLVLACLEIANAVGASASHNSMLLLLTCIPKANTPYFRSSAAD